MTTSAVPNYSGYRFPAEVISHAVWLYFRFPLSLPMVDELLAARGRCQVGRSGRAMAACRA
jgi:transposase-like protein